MNDSCAGGAQNINSLYPGRFLPKFLKLMKSYAF